MRGLAAIIVVLCAASARAENLPPGTLSAVAGATSGTGADAKRLGFGGYAGIQTSWQPSDSDRKFGWTLRWGVMFGRLYNGSAVRIGSEFESVNMDLSVGARFRPGLSPHRYLTARFGAGMMRTSQPLITSDGEMQRAFIGGIASVGLDQYFSSFMLGVDVRYGLFGGGAPQTLSLLVSLGLTGP